MLNSLYYLQILKWMAPAAFMLGSAPNFIFLWSGWRVLTIVLPTRVYEVGDDFLYSLYQKLILFFYENYTGVEIILYGHADELLRKKENVILMSNHQSTVDWIVADMLAQRQGSIGHIRYILKDGLKYFPLYGTYFRQHSCVYVKRSGRFEQHKARFQLEDLMRNKTPFWMVVFPEGTRYSPERLSIIEKSKQFARDHGLPVLDNVLTPRTKAIQMCVEHLKHCADAVYDVTIAYSDTIDDVTGKRKASAGLTDFLCGTCRQLHIHINRIEMKSVPQGDQKFKAWLTERFQEKQRLLEKFYSGNCDEVGTLMPGGQKNQLSLRSTFPVLLFWTAVNIPMWFTPQGRSLYWKVAVFGTLTGWLWMTIRS